VTGNTYDAFMIEDLSGRIRVSSPLDYENITSVSKSAVQSMINVALFIRHLTLSSETKNKTLNSLHEISTKYCKLQGFSVCRRFRW